MSSIFGLFSLSPKGQKMKNKMNKLKITSNIYIICNVPFLSHVKKPNLKLELLKIFVFAYFSIIIN